MPTDNEVGHWTTLGERMQELHNRLVAWAITVPDGFNEAWAEAHRRFLETIAEADNPLTLDKNTVLKSFEDSLAAFDTIYVQSRQLAAELGDVDFNDDDD